MKPGMLSEKIRKPTLVLDERKCRENIRMMARKAENWGVIFRPHFKTHQSATVGRWFREEGVSSITVSSVTMAQFFSADGWNDITIAFPLNPREIGLVKKLTLNASLQLNILTSGTEHLSMLLGNAGFSAGCFIEIDTGYKRSGVAWNDFLQLERMAELLRYSSPIRLKGLLVHSGESYSAASRENIAKVFHDSSNKMEEAKRLAGVSDILLSTGDTPTCCVAGGPLAFDEIRPGNFVFFDLMQSELGSCTREQIAVAVFCPVVDRNLNRNEVLIYGGGVHLSKEALIGRDGKTVYGEIAFPSEEGWIFPGKRIFLGKITQEHGIISVPAGMMDHFRIGDLVAVIPVHSCLTVDVHRKFITTDGDLIEGFSPK